MEFYINNIILLRFNQGRPYYKLSSIMNGFKFDYDRDQYSNNILLPMVILIISLVEISW